MANEGDNDKVITKEAEPTEPELEEEDGEDDDEFINSLLEDVDTEEEQDKQDEEQRRKNKDAEEARKRRAAEAKAKAEAKPQQPVASSEEKPVVEETPKQEEPNEPDVNRLGQQLVDFKAKYPEVDLANLDNDKAFKKFIDGKLLGKKDFTKLYEEYVELKSEITGVELKTVQSNYQKAQSSSGSSISPIVNPSEVFSEEELRKVSQRLPFMSPKEAASIEAKLKKSIAYYEGKK